MTPAEFLAQVRAVHSRDPLPREFPASTACYCYCDELWPCQTERLALAVEAVLDLCVLRDRGLALLDIDDETGLFRAAIAEALGDAV